MNLDLDNMDERYEKIYEKFQNEETISGIDLDKMDHVISSKDSIKYINNHIKKDGLVLSKTRDETTGLSYLLLRHIVQTHDDCWTSLEVPGGATKWSTTEKKNLHNIATRILSDDRREVWIDSKDGETRETYKRLLEHKWLNFSKNSSTLSLGPRFLGQMKPWIQWKTQKNYHCVVCSLCMVRGYFCDNCNQGYHLMCLKKKSKTDPQCQTCQSRMKNNLGLTEHNEGEPPSKKRRLDDEDDDAHYGSDDYVRKEKMEIADYECYWCAYNGPSEKALKSHIICRHEAPRFNCPHCSFKCPEKGHLKYHVQSTHEGIEYQCQQCDFKCRTEINLKTHVRNMHEGKVFHCDQCSKTFNTKNGRSEHIKSIHSGIKYTCEICGKQFVSKGLLKRHMQALHEGLRFSCDQCNFSTASKTTLKRHIKTIHEKVKSFLCDQCDYKAASKNTLNSHIQSAHDLIRYPCDQCEYQATEKGALKSHRWIVHSGVKLQCDQCNYQTAGQRTLDTHIKFVHEGIGYTCDICGHKTSTASNLKLHIKRKHNK